MNDYEFMEEDCRKDQAIFIKMLESVRCPGELSS